MEVRVIDGHWHGIDPKTGEVRGRVDFQGGGGLIGPEEPIIHDEKDISGIPAPPADELIRSGALDGIRSIVQQAGEDFFVISYPGHFTVECLTFKRGKAQAMIDILDSPDFCHHIQVRALEAAIQRGIALARIGIDGLMIADTFGGVIGPQLFKEYCLPNFKRFVEAITREFGEKRPLIYLHICGDSRRLFELMADTGVDCIEPLDALGGVSVADAKRRVGRRVALMGEVNTFKLAHRPLTEFKEDIRRCLDEGASEGCYILACSDMLPNETPIEKVQAMVRAAHAYRY